MQHVQCSLAEDSAPHSHSEIQADSCIIILKVLHLRTQGLFSHWGKRRDNWSAESWPEYMSLSPIAHWPESITCSCLKTVGLEDMRKWNVWWASRPLSQTTKNCLHFAELGCLANQSPLWNSKSGPLRAKQSLQNWKCILPNYKVTGNGRELRNKTQVISMTQMSTELTQ